MCLALGYIIMAKDTDIKQVYFPTQKRIDLFSNCSIFSSSLKDMTAVKIKVNLYFL